MTTDNGFTLDELTALMEHNDPTVRKLACFAHALLEREETVYADRDEWRRMYHREKKRSKALEGEILL